MFVADNVAKLNPVVAIKIVVRKFVFSAANRSFKLINLSIFSLLISLFDKLNSSWLVFYIVVIR